MKKTINFTISVVALVLCGIGFFLFRIMTDTSPIVQTPPRTSETPAPDEIRAIAFGDSLTAGYGLPLRESYPAQLEELLRDRGYPVRVVNAGVSGETTAGARERASFIRSQNPDIVILGIGGNDALRAIPIESTRQNLEEIIDILTEGPSAPTLLLLRIVAPQNAGLVYKEVFDALYPEMRDAYGLTLVPFVEGEVFRAPQYLLPDGIHPNKDGYALLVERYVAPAVVGVLPQTEMRGAQD